MYGKALLFVILVVVGAVLPYLLADQKFIGKLNNVFSGDTAVSVAPTHPPPASQSGSVVTKPTTAGKPVTTPVPRPKSKADSLYTAQTYSVPIQPPVASSGIPSDPALARRNATPTSKTKSMVGPRGVPIEHLLSFNVTPSWVSENWPRVTTSLAETDLQGWRVPVAVDVPHDLIGSVTYYFDRQSRAQRIILHGFTTNPGAMVEIAQTRYAMQRLPTHLGEFYVHANGSRPLGGLRIGNPAVRKANGRCEVLLELNRDGSSYGMSHEFADKLRTLSEQEQKLGPIPETPLFQEVDPRLSNAKSIGQDLEWYDRQLQRSPRRQRRSWFSWLFK